MSWFDDQIRQRMEKDDMDFTESFQQIAGAVLGRHLSDALNDSRQVTTDAVGEILKFYHVKAVEVPDSITDMNEVLEYIMRPHGIMRRTVHLDKGWYKDAVGAMLGTRKDDGSVVALLPSNVAGYRFYDRKTGRYVHINRGNADLIERDAICFYKPFPLEKMGIGKLMKYIWEQISVSDFVIIIGAMAVATLVGMVLPHVNKLLFGDVLASGSTAALLGAGIFMLSATVSSMIFGGVRTLANSRVNTKLTINVEAAAMMRMLSLPADFFKDYSSGELSNRLQYINSLANQLVSMVLSTTLSSLFSLAYVFQIFLYAPALVAPAITMTFLSILVTVSTVLLQMNISRRTMIAGSKVSGITYALITGVQKIRLSGAEKRAFSRWARAYSEQASLTFNPPTFIKVSGVISTGVSLVGTAVMYFFAIQSHVSVAEYYAFNSAYGMVSGAFTSLAGIALSIAQIKPTLEMVKPFFETIPEVAQDKEVITRLSGGVELSNISFRYKEDMPLVLDNLSLKIRPGEYVAIVGKTGCGKSTLMRILLGFETPQRGAVYYDSKDLKRIDVKSLRRKIGSVMQNGKLFTGDIYSNITIAAPWLTVDDAWKAAEIAGLAEDIRQMPMGMNTLLSEGQGGVSGGQRQRILIARAVAPKPKILMFDEATSALDNITQKQVSEALDNMKCTRIIIAHRLSTIRQCDRIIVLDKGKIIEDGTYEELLSLNGYFAELVARQRLDEPA